MCYCDGTRHWPAPAWSIGLGGLYSCDIDGVDAVDGYVGSMVDLLCFDSAVEGVGCGYW